MSVQIHFEDAFIKNINKTTARTARTHPLPLLFNSRKAPKAGDGHHEPQYFVIPTNGKLYKQLFMYKKEDCNQVLFKIHYDFNIILPFGKIVGHCILLIVNI